MKVAHLLRKYNPDEWGGTEAAVLRLIEGLRAYDIVPLAFAPAIEHVPKSDPFAEARIAMRRYGAILPVWGITPERRAQAIAIGGNLLSFDLLGQLLREPGLEVIHTHTLNRLGGTALTAARRRRLPLLVTIHGGLYDLPEEVSAQLAEPLQGGWEWGRIFGLLLRSKKVVAEADAVITCNRREADLIAERHPRQRVIVQPHGVETALYRRRWHGSAAEALPALGEHPYLLVLGRLDPTKNQSWLLEEAPALVRRYPEMRFVFVGPSTNEAYYFELQAIVRSAGLEDRVFFTGGMAPGDSRLITLLQRAAALVVPSQSETFGLVILEAWAAGTPVLSSRTSGALGLLREGENGWLFDVARPETFHAALDDLMANPARRAAVLERGREEVERSYDLTTLAGRVKDLYRELIERKKSRCTT